MIPGDKGLGKRIEPGNTVGQDGVIQQGKPSGPPHEGSRETYEGRIISVPRDYCWTPCGSGKVLIGYKIWAYQREATNLANSVTQASLRSHVKGSIIKHCYGDSAGKLGGFTSGTHNAECTPKTWSKTVLFEGRNAVRDSDEWWMNHYNTWGVLDYKKDTSQGAAPDPQLIEPKLFLARGPEAEPPGGNMPPSVSRPVETEPTEPNLNYGTGAAGGPPPAEVEPQTAHTRYLQSLPSSSWTEAGAYWQAPDGTLVRKDQFEWLMSTRPSTATTTQTKTGTPPPKPPSPQPSNVVTQTGSPQKCPCIVGTYNDVKPLCRNAKCGGQAHHIVADKYLRLGTRPKPGAIDPGRLKGMPSLNDGPSICLNGNAGDEDSDHNIAHQNDGYIQALGNANKPQGTLPIGQIRAISVEAAKAAAPSDPACQSKIDDWTGMDKYGGNASALVRATNNPPEVGSPAMNYFINPKPLE